MKRDVIEIYNLFINERYIGLLEGLNTVKNCRFIIFDEEGFFVNGRWKDKKYPLQEPGIRIVENEYYAIYDIRYCASNDVIKMYSEFMHEVFHCFQMENNVSHDDRKFLEGSALLFEMAIYSIYRDINVEELLNDYRENMTKDIHFIYYLGAIETYNKLMRGTKFMDILKNNCDNQEKQDFLSYDLKVGYSCNNRCKHCVIADNKANKIKTNKNIDLTLNEIKSLINENCQGNVKRIVLTGGEVTIRKDFPEIIDLCKEKDLIVSIQSNGRKFADKKYVSYLKGIKEVSLAIALHSSQGSIHDTITDAKGSFRETCKGIKNLSEEGISVCVKVVISKYNQNDLASLTRLANDLGAESVNMAFPHGLGAAGWNFDTVIPRYRDLVKELKTVCDISKETGIWVDFETIPFCIVPENIDRVSELIYADEKTICSPVGVDVFDWDKERKRIKTKGENCQECRYNSICEGVWTEYADRFGMSEFVGV